MDLPQYDELHVVSDLHMGGKPGFQVLRETGRLAGFVRRVAKQRPDDRVALLLNGDVIDSLAEDVGGYVATVNAVAMLQRIMDYKEFSMVWDALGEFVRTPQRKLVVLIGNHDIELAFPGVQREILNRLAGDDPAARARVEFSTMGAGYRCVVGNASVFCTHGNEVDPWNYNSYEAISKVARRLNAGRALDAAEWEPNAGTQMVKDVMNEVKVTYAWIDLLKPETQAAVGVLLVLDPKQLSKLNRLIPILSAKVKGGGEVNRRLSADGAAAPATAAVFAPAAQLLGANLREGIRDGTAIARPALSEMLARVENTYASRDGALQGDETLGTGQYAWDRLTGWLTGVKEDEALRRALKDWLAQDRTFEVDDQDDTFKAVTDSASPDIDFIVTGHTHLERAIDRGWGRYYFNTGTWIRLLRFSDEVLKSAETFARVYKVLVNGSMNAIDDPAKFGAPPLVLDQTSAVCIRAENAGTVGELVHVTGDGTTQTPVKAFGRH
jgi:UDP-2,3-diacylglucosamine pyrophosphatase LpxH